MEQASSTRFLVPADDPCFDSGVDIQPDHSYRFIVDGKWIDLRPPAVGPEGDSNPGGLRALAGWAKRLPDARWMALLMRTKGTAGTSDWRLLGKGDTLQSGLPPGRLQLCANDVLGFYFNNKGEMDVTVIDVTGQGQDGASGEA